MFFFFGYGPGILFLLLGLFMILSGFRRPRDRDRLIYSGVGSIAVGLGNLLMLVSMLLGLGVVAIGVAVILWAARLRG